MNVKRMAVAVAATLAIGSAVGLPVASGASTRTAAYNAAKHIWKAALCRAAYQQGGLWRRAAGALDGAGPRAHSYRVAAGWLRTIASLPETSATETQGRLFAKDARHLDHFFHTPGLYVRYTGPCPIGE